MEALPPSLASLSLTTNPLGLEIPIDKASEIDGGKILTPRRDCLRCAEFARQRSSKLIDTSVRRCSQERLTWGTVTSTMRMAAHPSGCARCGAGAGCRQ